MLNPLMDNISHLFASANSERAAKVSTVVDAEDSRTEDVEKVEIHQVRIYPGQEKNKSDGSPKDSVELSAEAKDIRNLQIRDREVKAHEAAHAAAGGAYAGSPRYSYERGPDGKSYATGGEVSIDISPVSGDPEATMQKAQQVRAAALAPAQPSAQDMKVAQKAQSMAARARQEMVRERQNDLSGSELQGGDQIPDQGPMSANESDNSSSKQPVPGDMGGIARLNIYS